MKSHSRRPTASCRRLRAAAATTARQRRTARWFALSLALLFVAACGDVGPARIPVSGVSGTEGGSEETIYYDQAGHAHFR